MSPNLPVGRSIEDTRRFGRQILDRPRELVNVQTLVVQAGSHYQG